MNMEKTALRIVCVVGALGLVTPAFATEQVYHPISPTFGGNPTNGTFLLSVAQGQGEGVNSGNQGPNLTGLTNALGNLGSGSSSTAAGASSSSVANPLSNSARMP
jgi:curli production assembly/transport component CsgF